LAGEGGGKGCIVDGVMRSSAKHRPEGIVLREGRTSLE